MPTGAGGICGWSSWGMVLIRPGNHYFDSGSALRWSFFHYYHIFSFVIIKNPIISLTFQL
jgi:hypothetical protein